MNHEALTELMHTESDSPPQTRVDLALVLRDGKRRRRRRALIAPAVAGAVVLALAAGAAVVAGGYRAGPPSPPPGATGLTAAPQPSAPAAFDPMRLHVVAGWIPDGMVAAPPTSAQTVQRLSFGPKTKPEPGPSVSYLSVMLYAAGVTPVELLPVPRMRPPPTIAPAPPVNGRPAQSWTWPGVRAGALAWEWAPGAWAVVGAIRDEANDAHDVVRRVAENVRTDVDIPIMVPFTMATPPAPLRVAVVSGREQLPDFEYRFDLALADITGLPTNIDSPTGTAPEVTISVLLDNQAHIPAPDRVIGGYRAFIHSDEFTFSVTLYGVSGYVVNVMIIRTAPRGREVSEEQAIAMASSVVPLGRPTDRSQWTDKPLR